MARTSRVERHRRRESALALESQGKGFSDVVSAQMSQWGCSRPSAQRDCRWAHDQLQLGMDSHDAQHLVCHMATTSTPPAFPLWVTRTEWSRITRELVASTISYMDLDPVTLAEVEKAFIGAGQL